MKIEKKLEDEAVRDKERMKEEKQNLQLERRRREADIKRIEWSLNRVKEYAAWEASVVLQQNFIMTKSSPQIFYLPKVHCAATEALLEASAKATQGLHYFIHELQTFPYFYFHRKNCQASG